MSMYTPPLPKNAYGLRAFRVIDEEIRNYRPVTFRDTWAGFDTYLRRMKMFGMLAPSYTGFAVDALDRDGNILQTWSITERGLAYLRRELNLRMEPRRKVPA
jgi:hypothetical protein